MTPSEDPSLSLTEVRERFASSTQLLDNVQEQLGRIVEGEDRRAEIRDALTASASSVDNFAKAAGEAASTLSAAQRSATEAFTSLSAIADGTELRAVRDEVARLRHSQESMAERQQALEAALAEGLAQVARTQEQVLARVDESTQLREQLLVLTQQFESLRAAAGGRAIRRAGLEPGDS